MKGIQSAFLHVLFFMGLLAFAEPAGARSFELGDFTLRSTHFLDGKYIPSRHSRKGANLSPPLKWAGGPDLATQYAIICEDVDKEGGEPWVHWLIYNLPGDLHSLPEGIEKTAMLTYPMGAFQGLNSWGNVGYEGPEPVIGTYHRIRFRILAMNYSAKLRPGMSKAELLSAIGPYVVAETKFTGLFKR